MSYCIVTEWEDGTVAVTAIDVEMFRADTVEPGADPTRDELDHACRLVALEVEGDDNENEITREYDPTDPNQLPHYAVRGDAGDGGDACYVVEMGAVKLRRKG